MTAPLPLVVLVHGAFHGAWCWAGLQAELDKLGVASLAVDLPGHGASFEPLTDLHGDADMLARTVAHLARPVVLVGHSYGGAVISQASTEPYVQHLVYLAALVPDCGQSPADQMSAMPKAEGAAARLFRRLPDGVLEADPALAPAAFYHRCQAAAVTAAVARLSPQRASTMKQPLSRAMWQTVPSTYIRCLDDQAVPIAAQDLLAARCAATLTIDADHSPFLGRPAELAQMLVGVVGGV